MFQIDPAFVATSHALGELTLCELRLQDDARYPWLVLIPRGVALREIEDLMAMERAQLMDEIVHAGRALRVLGEALGVPVEKLNVGALGNVTPQLHVHVVGRRHDDPAWPGPVWGHSPAEPYTSDELAYAVETARRALGL
ncbi:HIT domain-containing protein [Phenylobacterium sp. 20VBR1]|uniref:HIT domain-containing protein n=1 Tax=Phenylobacterium glaciei TaxID=2803784 RepID=A0A941HV17_9CAUL|nr:HIT domain-containing protein [Phenylobacterium glaciei]MBR7618165.1 HIT domain-containing protein [Phenylobacterium glaciei]